MHLAYSTTLCSAPPNNRLRIAALVDRGAGVPQILHVDCAVIGAVEFRDHRVPSQKPASTVTRVGWFVQRKSHAAAAGGAGASGLAGIKSGLAGVRNFGLAELRFVPQRTHALQQTETLQACCAVSLGSDVCIFDDLSPFFHLGA